MTAATALDWITRMLWIAIEVGGIPLAVTVVVALLVSVLQAATQVNDAAVGFAPKLIAIIACLVIGGEWMLGRLTDFTSEIVQALATLGQNGIL